MPKAQSRRTRARDLDRTEVCSVLDTAYADGQLDPDEHRTRTATAMAAKTLGELRELVEDLQLERPMPELREHTPAAPAGRSSKIVAVVVTLLLVGAGFGIGRLTGSTTAAEGGTPVAGQEPAGGAGVDPLVVPPVALHTPGGLRGFIADVHAHFGTPLVAGATIYPDYATVDRPAPGAPARAESSYYKGGFEAPGSAGSRDPDVPLVDLSAIDVDVIMRLLAGAGETLNVQNPTMRYILVRDTGDGPEVAIYASNQDFGESGYLEARPDGEIIGVHAHQAG